MPNKLRWGFLSTARINRALIPPLRSSARNELLAVASRDLEHARAYAAERQVPRAYGSYTELLADPEIDVIYISLPNSLHAEWTVKACQAGKHVLCEKPLATRLEDVDAIIAAARQAGVVVAEAFIFPHHRQTQRVIEMVRGGSLGQVGLVRGSFSFTLTRPEDVRLRADLDGGSLWDIGCYPVSYARRLLGSEPVEVFGWQELSPSGVDQTFAGQMRFPDGVIAQIDCSFVLAPRMFVEIFGRRASLYIPNPYRHDTTQPMLLKQDQSEQAISLPEADSYLGEVEDMADAILEGKPPLISLEDSRGNTAALLALLASARQGKPVKL